MKVIHVLSELGHHLGGPSRSVQGLVGALESVGVEAWLLTMRPGESPWLPGVAHFKAACARTYAGQRSAMLELAEDVRPDIVHLHNLWYPDLHAAACVCRARGIPYVFAPRGALEPWSLRHKWLKKKIGLWLYQRHDLEKAAALHATAETEKDHFLQLGFKNPVIVLPNGISVPSVLPCRKERSDDAKRLLFLSRIHRKKGLVELAEAWSLVRPEGWKLEIVGPAEDDSLSRTLALAREGGFADDFIVTGPLDDDLKWQAYARADALVLPTHSENFGIVVAEALYAGIPVITTKGTPWRELEAGHCGWWILNSPESLASAMRDLFALSDADRRAMGRRGRRLVEERYLWPAIAARMKEAYAEILRARTLE